MCNLDEVKLRVILFCFLDVMSEKREETPNNCYAEATQKKLTQPCTEFDALRNKPKGGFLFQRFDIESETKKLFKSSSKVSFLLTELAKLGCPFKPDVNLAFETCSTENLDAGFDDSASQILLCTNKISNEKQLETLLGNALLFRPCHRKLWEGTKD